MFFLRFGTGKPVQTFVFMDFETSGAFKQSWKANNLQFTNPHEFTDALNRLILESWFDVCFLCFYFRHVDPIMLLRFLVSTKRRFT